MSTGRLNQLQIRGRAHSGLKTTKRDGMRSTCLQHALTVTLSRFGI
jgi:hypothetical protein